MEGAQYNNALNQKNFISLTKSPYFYKSDRDLTTAASSILQNGGYSSSSLSNMFYQDHNILSREQIIPSSFNNEVNLGNDIRKLDYNIPTKARIETNNNTTKKGYNGIIS